MGRITFHPVLATPSDPIPEEDAVVRPAATAEGGADTRNHEPDGHCEIDDTGGQTYGVVITQLPPPVKGTSLTGSHALVVNSGSPVAVPDPHTVGHFPD